MSIYGISIITSLLLLCVTFYALAKRRLDFQYVLFWTVLSVLIIVVALNVGWLERIAAALNVFYAPSVLFAAALVFLLVFVFYITMFISNITKRVIRLTQEVGLLKSKIDALEKKEEDA